MDNRPKMLKATLIGGGVAGVLSAIPGLNLLNCACCALVIGGGFFAAYLYSKECAAAGVEFRPGNGALVGLVAALFYAVAASIVGGIVQMIMPTDIGQIMEQFDQADMPPETRDMIGDVLEMMSGSGAIFIGFFVNLIAGAIFSTIGGLIGGAVFKVETPPAPPAQGESGGWSAPQGPTT